MNDSVAGPAGHIPLPGAYAEPPIPDSVRSIMVFGGSFDPPHVGHQRLATEARKASGADWLLVIPAAQSPHKQAPPLFSADERMELLRLAFAETECVSLCRMELDRRIAHPNEPSYTVDTLHTLRGYLPLGTKLRLLIGADQALSLHRWREPRAILALAEPVIMRRSLSSESAGSLAERIASNWSDSDADEVDAAAWRRRIVDIPMIEASSTRVRELLAGDCAEQETELQELLGEQVYERIREFKANQ